MKNRDYKNFAPGGIYHVFNRGVNKNVIFNDEDDFLVFLSRLKENLFPDLMNKSKLAWVEKRRKLLPPNSFDLICYCLMPNHFHLLIQQKTDLPVAKIVSKVCTSYSMYFNKKYGRIGTLFQDRFRAVLVESNEQLLWTSYYVHQNPIEGGLTDNLRDYKWSSYSEYFDSHSSLKICKTEIINNQFHSGDQYLKYFEGQEITNVAPLQGLYFDFDED